VRELARRVSKSKSVPGGILALSPRGAVIGHLLLLEFGRPEIPMYVAVNFLNDSPGKAFPEPPAGDWIVAETNRSQVLIPKGVLMLDAKRLLVVDDWALSGDMMHTVRQLLLSSGIEESRLTTCTLAATDGAIRNGKAPNHFIWTVDAHDTYFPWGSAR